MKIIKLTNESKKNILENLLKRSPNNYGKFEAAVNDILADIKENGDKALFDYTKKFDKADINESNVIVTRLSIFVPITKSKNNIAGLIQNRMERF